MKFYYEESGNGFFVSLSYIEQKISTTPITTSCKILLLIKKNPKITNRELPELTELSIEGVKYNITKLKKEGTIKLMGNNRTGRWMLTNVEKDC